MNSILFHTLKGLNISFKPISLDDIQDIHNFLSDKEVKKFIGWNLFTEYILIYCTLIKLTITNEYF